MVPSRHKYRFYSRNIFNYAKKICKDKLNFISDQLHENKWRELLLISDYSCRDVKLQVEPGRKSIICFRVNFTGRDDSPRFISKYICFVHYKKEETAGSCLGAK